MLVGGTGADCPRLTAEEGQDILGLIEQYLPRLWQTQRCSGDRSLHVVLRVAEQQLARRRGVDVQTFRQELRQRSERTPQRLPP